MKGKIIQFIKKYPGIIIFPSLFILLISPLYILPEKQSKTYEACIEMVGQPGIKTAYFLSLNVLFGYSHKEEIKKEKQAWDLILKEYNNWRQAQGYYCPIKKIFE